MQSKERQALIGNSLLTMTIINILKKKGIITDESLEEEYNETILKLQSKEDPDIIGSSVH